MRLLRRGPAGGLVGGSGVGEVCGDCICGDCVLGGGAYLGSIELGG